MVVIHTAFMKLYNTLCLSADKLWSCKWHKISLAKTVWLWPIPVPVVVPVLDKISL